MSLAWLSVGALVVAVTLSCTTTINIGVLAIALALIVGVGFGGMSSDAVIAGFPSDLLFTLVAVTLLFSIANVNGTLAHLTDRAVRLCKGNALALPVMFFVVGFIIATIGAGATPASALLAPPAMAAAARVGMPPLLMAIMAGNGVLAGTLSPFAPTGIVAHGVMARIGLGGYEWQTFAYNAFAHLLVGVAGFVLLGGLRVLRNGTSTPSRETASASSPRSDAFETRHWLTTAGIAALVIAVVGFSVDVGVAAIIIAAVLILLGTVEESSAIKRMPWGVILMVTGVTVLIVMMRETQGLELITNGIANVSTPATINPIVAFGAGLISVYSSTSGVVLPAFLPMVPSLAEQLGGMDPLNIAWSMAVSASLVDLSSLSTVGALYMASAAEGTDMRRLFNALLVWGLSMSLVGAVLCWVLFG
ncbi:MAG: SLC13 family permease [Gammaproteobacteria bacterium]|jgi:di/tricarboxylate transporter